MGMNPGRRRPSAAGATDRPDVGLAPPPAVFRHLEARLREFSHAADAQEQDGRPASRKAVSLKVQPELVLALRQALVLAGGIKAAFVHGSIAKGEQSPASEIELMVIVDATYAGCFGGFHDAEKLLGRRIRANFVSEQEWRRERLRGSRYFSKINTRPRIVIFASTDDLLG
jgi:hypothetical protein